MQNSSLRVQIRINKCTFGVQTEVILGPWGVPGPHTFVAGGFLHVAIYIYIYIYMHLLYLFFICAPIKIAKQAVIG